jgi:CBS domain containing-hemolysin-like protein
MIYLIGFLWVLWIIVWAVKPARVVRSDFELERLAMQGDRRARFDRQRKNFYSAILTIKYIKIIVLSVVLVGIAATNYGVSGTIWSIVGAVFGLWLSGRRVVSSLAQKMYTKMERPLMRRLKKMRTLMNLIDFRVESAEQERAVESIQELRYLLDNTANLVDVDTDILLKNSLTFGEAKVREIMTVSSEIISVRKDEFLGPLVLDELYKKGHSVLPVVSPDLDHIIGTINLEYLLNLDVKKSQTAEKAMEPRVYYVEQNSRLLEVLSMFVSSGHHLIIVVDRNGKTVGLVAMSDILQKLFGDSINQSSELFEHATTASKHRQ